VILNTDYGISGDAIRLIRRKRGLSQTAFAQENGVSRTAVADWEQGKAKISPDNEKKLRDRYGAEVDEPLVVGIHSSKSSLALAEIVKKLAAVNPDLVLDWQTFLGKWDSFSDKDIRFFAHMMGLVINQLNDKHNA
jgi:transcriptional regulator with XRE-family HTH domain